MDVSFQEEQLDILLEELVIFHLLLKFVISLAQFLIFFVVFQMVFITRQHNQRRQTDLHIIRLFFITRIGDKDKDKKTLQVFSQSPQVPQATAPCTPIAQSIKSGPNRSIDNDLTPYIRYRQFGG